MLDLESSNAEERLIQPGQPSTSWATLRQIVLATESLGEGLAVLAGALGLGLGFTDPLLAEHDIADHTVAVGRTTYLELVTPTRADSPLARRLGKHGPGGYALSVQVPDAVACRDRALARGISVVIETEFQGANIVQLHPGELGMLLELDGVPDPACWFWDSLDLPAAPAPLVEDVLAIVIAVSQPDIVAALWRGILDLPGDGTTVRLGARAITFVPSTEGCCGLRAIELMATAAADLPRLPVQLAGVELQYVRD